MAKKHPAPATRATPFSVVILAAGEGKRMKSALPKVLQPLAGRPLLKHVIDTARSLDPAAIHVVYGHGGERVREALGGEAGARGLEARARGGGGGAGRLGSAGAAPRYGARAAAGHAPDSGRARGAGALRRR